MSVQGILVSDKTIFENCIFETHFLSAFSTNATQWNYLNKFASGLSIPVLFYQIGKIGFGQEVVYVFSISFNVTYKLGIV